MNFIYFIVLFYFNFPAKTKLGCHIVITNVSSQRFKLDLLMQIPAGSLPVQNGFFTKGRFVELNGKKTNINKHKQT